MTEMIIFDLETTGPDAFSARIVTLYAGILRADGTISREVDLLVRPDGFDIPPEATAVHGITTAQAAAEGSVPLAVALSRARHLFESYQRLPIAGHNLAYDLTVLAEEDRRIAGSSASTWPETGALRHPVLDSIVLDRHVDKYRRGSRQLTAVAAHYGIELDDAHNAKADAVAAGKIVQKLLAHPDLGGLSLMELHAAQVGWRAEQSASLQAYLRRYDPTVNVDPGWPVQIGAAA